MVRVFCRISRVGSDIVMKMAASDLELLEQYARHNSEEAFGALVNRRLDLVYSAALRQVGLPQLAKEVAQSVFVDLARNASRLKPDTFLTAWLYQVTRRTAIDVVRKKSSRQARERVAVEMADMKSNPAEWTQIRPLLDEAMEALDETDRNAILLRYFENRSLREVGQTLGTSEDAAQKRVSRAVERLRGLLGKQGLAVGAGSLVALLSANAIQAAPAGLKLTISAAAALSGTAIHSTATCLGATKTIAMTTLQKTLITAAIAAAGTGVYEAHRASHLQAQLQAQQAQQAPLAEEARQLRQQFDDTTNRLAALQQENEQLNRELAELPKLRGEVSRLRSEGRGLAPSPAGNASDPMDAAAKAWQARVEQLKQCLNQNPQAAIPEFKFLTEQDWLDAAKDDLKTDQDYRRALSSLRRAGESKFIASQLQPAVTNYVRANKGQIPADLAQLQQFFPSPMDEASLQRYEIVSRDRVPEAGFLSGDWFVAQKAPVDKDCDNRFVLGPTGGWGTIRFGSDSK